jgi:hypothetical protein
MINYYELARGYSTRNGRPLDPAKQRAWLIHKYRLPAVAVDSAMATLYLRIAKGERFSNGESIDHELLQIARHAAERVDELVLKAGMEELRKAAFGIAEEFVRPATWLRHPVRSIAWHRTKLMIACGFVAGLVVGGAAAWII